MVLLIKKTLSLICKKLILIRTVSLARNQSGICFRLSVLLDSKVKKKKQLYRLGYLSMPWLLYIQCSRYLYGSKLLITNFKKNYISKTPRYTQKIYKGGKIGCD